MRLRKPAGEPVLFRGRQGEVQRGGVREDGAANVLDVHLPAPGDAEVADLPGPGQPAEAVGLDFAALPGRAGPGVEVVLKGVQAFIQHDRLDGVGGNDRALVEGLAGLFEPAPGAARNRLHHLNGDPGDPGAVDVISDVFICWQGGFDRLDPGNVTGDVGPADLGRMGAIALGPRGVDQRDHLFRCAGGDRGIDGHAFALCPSEQLEQRRASALARDIPERHVERGFGVRMAGQGLIHRPVETVDIAGVLADQHRREQFHGRADTAAKGWQISLAPGTALPPTDQPAIGLNADKGAVQRFELQPSPGQPVGLGQRQATVPERDACDLHGRCAPTVATNAAATAAATVLRGIIDSQQRCCRRAASR